MLLQLPVKCSPKSYGSSLLMAENSQSTSNVLANDLDLSELGRSTLSDLSNTQLDIRTPEKDNYLRKFLFVLLNLTHKLITTLLAKFNSLCLGYRIRIPFIQLSTHFSISTAIFGSRERKPLGIVSRRKIRFVYLSPFCHSTIKTTLMLEPMCSLELYDGVNTQYRIQRKVYCLDRLCY